MSTIKFSTVRRGKYYNAYAQYGVTVWSTTGKKNFYFQYAGARENFIRMVKKKRNYRFHRKFAAPNNW